MENNKQKLENETLEEEYKLGKEYYSKLLEKAKEENNNQKLL